MLYKVSKLKSILILQLAQMVEIIRENTGRFSLKNDIQLKDLSKV